MTFLKWAAAAVIVAALAAPRVAVAQVSVDQRVLAQKVLASMHVLDTMIAGTESALTKALAVQTQLHPEQATFITAMKPKMQAIILKRLPDLSDAMADVYAAEFTTDELNAFLAFYQTPAGTKLATSQVEISQHAQGVATTWGQSVAKDFFAEMAQSLTPPNGQPK